MRTRLVREAALLLLLFYSLQSAANCTGNGALGLSHYDGTVGKYPVRMTLQFDGDAINGIYFYTSQLKDIRIRGKITGGSQLVLEEMDSAGHAVVARFEGSFPTSDPEHHFQGALQCEVIAGKWGKIGAATGSSTVDGMPFYLALGNANDGDLEHQYRDAGASEGEGVNKGALRFREAVKQGDRKIAASLIKYPITVGRGTQCKKTILNAQMMLQQYEVVLSPLKEAIVQDVPRAMWVRNGMVM